MSNIDSETVKVVCTSKHCRLVCKQPFLMVFDSASEMWNDKKIFCKRKGFIPKRISAKCIPSGSKSEFNQPLDQVKTACHNTIFEKYNVNPQDITVICKNSACTVKCNNENRPIFVWPDGTAVERETFKCQKGNVWKPNRGTITCLS